LNEDCTFAPGFGFFIDPEEIIMRTIGLLIASNIFMTFAWYGHLKFHNVALWKVILISWGIAFFEYCLMVPANRIGYGTFTAVQLKTIQEVITLTVFSVFFRSLSEGIFSVELSCWVLFYYFSCLFYFS